MTIVTVGDPVRARLGRWPHEPDVVHVVLLDHQMVPTVADVKQWIAQAGLSAPRCIRTGAMFPDAAESFRQSGFHQIDELALLEAPLARLDRAAVRQFGPLRPSTERMRSSQLAQVVDIDRRAFGDPWGNDEQSLHDVMGATARHRARVVRNDGDIDGFAISGQSGPIGYLQRLAVREEARRQGVATVLVTDALRWMRRRGAGTAMVNTAVDNHGALELYRSHGFDVRPETLSILELALR